MYGRKFGARSIGENRRAITTRDGRDYPLAGGGWHKEAAASNALDAIAGQRGLRNNPPLNGNRDAFDNLRSPRVISILFIHSLSSPRYSTSSGILGRRNSDCSKGKGGMIEEEYLVGLDHLFFSFFFTNGTRV